MIKNKIKASLLFHSYFDTLGFHNGKWEFNFGSSEIKNDYQGAFIWTSIMHEFFSLGGFSNIDITSWNSSDDTILNIASGYAMIHDGNDKQFIKEYTKVINLVSNEIRGPGFCTIQNLNKIKKTKKINSLKYKKTMGGNGAAMRTCSIGLILCNENDIDELIKQSIIASRITHNYYLGFLGGLLSALFTNFAMRNIQPWLWIDELLTIYNNGAIDRYMETTNIYDEYNQDKDKFFNKFEEYKEKRLGNFINKHKNFTDYKERLYQLNQYNHYLKPFDMSKFGSSGLSVCIVAYDALLNSITGTLDKPQYSLDSLIFFSTLHFGDNDTTGAIAGAWYGALNGFNNFNVERFHQLEFYNDLNKLSKKIFKKIL